MSSSFAIRTIMSARADRQPLVAVLAAGLASRFGGGKLDTDCAGKPLGQWALDAAEAAGLEPGVIVVGPQPPAFAQGAAGWGLLTNPASAAGLGTSVALACREADARSRNLLLLLADMPLVVPDHLRSLVSCPSTAVTRYPDGRMGVPASLVGGDLAKFMALGGDSGAGKLLSDLDTLETFDAGPDSLLDVDDVEALDRVRRILLAR